MKIKTLPEFPRTIHFPWKVKDDGDLISTESLLEKHISKYQFFLEEKVDGSNVGICYLNNHFEIRGRTKFIKKGNIKDTPANKQFATIWNWCYENVDKFKKLNNLGPFSIYGEWMLAQHGMFYNKLPSYFIAFDLYDYKNKLFVIPPLARQIIQDAGFCITPRLYTDSLTQENIHKLTECPSIFSDEKIEGVYVKFFDKQIQVRYKYVRPSFNQGELWNEKSINKNLLYKKELPS